MSCSDFVRPRGQRLAANEDPPRPASQLKWVDVIAFFEQVISWAWGSDLRIS